MSATCPAPGWTFAMIVPTPPASLTAAGLSTRALDGAVFPVGLPRSQTTILPATFAGSSTAVPPFAALEKHWRTLSASVPARPAFDARISGAEAAPLVTDVPWYVAPFPSVIVLRNKRSCELAATVVSHGLGWATVETVGPSLPAEAATKTPASSANRNATSFELRKLVVVPPIEKLIASTPSATA